MNSPGLHKEKTDQDKPEETKGEKREKILFEVHGSPDGFAGFDGIKRAYSKNQAALLVGQDHKLTGDNLRDFIDSAIVYKFGGKSDKHNDEPTLEELENALRVLESLEIKNPEKIEAILLEQIKIKKDEKEGQPYLPFPHIEKEGKK
ncbi:MAG: hypothetical protein M1127_00460 [Patescibacteria group bacterium]|nr:hypothetical protein [Patescibacteria group bacterium]